MCDFFVFLFVFFFLSKEGVLLFSFLGLPLKVSVSHIGSGLLLARDMFPKATRTYLKSSSTI